MNILKIIDFQRLSTIISVLDDSWYRREVCLSGHLGMLCLFRPVRRMPFFSMTLTYAQV